MNPKSLRAHSSLPALLFLFIASDIAAAPEYSKTVVFGLPLGLWYNPPAYLAAACIAFERFYYRNHSRTRLVCDGVVFAICILRPLILFPPVSGHGLFVAYAFLTGRAWFTRAATLLLLLVTLYAKIVLWHWDLTLWPGLILGVILGFVWRHGSRRGIRV